MYVWNWVKAYKFEASILAAAIVCLISGVILWQYGQYRPVHSPPPNKIAAPLPTAVPAPLFKPQEDPTQSRHHIVFYTKDGHLHSVLANLSHPIDLTTAGAPIERDNGCQVVMSQNGDRLYFEKGGSIGTIGSDGEGLKQLDAKYKVDCAHYWGLTGVNLDGSELLFYNYGGTDKAGYYLYSTKDNTFTYLYNPDTDAMWQYYFIQFVDQQPVFFNTADKYLYVFTIDSGTFSRFSKIPIDATDVSTDSNMMRLLPQSNVIVYVSAKTGNLTGESYSQIKMINYVTGAVANVSPRGDFAEYQFLEVSPSFSRILYGREIVDKITVEPREILRIDYYKYNFVTGKAEPWMIKAYPLTWVNDDSFIYLDRDSLIQYDLLTKREHFITSDVAGIVYSVY